MPVYWEFSSFTNSDDTEKISKTKPKKLKKPPAKSYIRIKDKKEKKKKNEKPI